MQLASEFCRLVSDSELDYQVFSAKVAGFHSALPSDALSVCLNSLYRRIFGFNT
jgi:hypothetical protein